MAFGGVGGRIGTKRETIFIDLALKRGYYVINVDKKTYAARADVDFHNRKHYTFIEADIATMTHIPPGVDYIVNFAAESHVENYDLTRRRTREVGHWALPTIPPWLLLP